MVENSSSDMIISLVSHITRDRSVDGTAALQATQPMIELQLTSCIVVLSSVYFVRTVQWELVRTTTRSTLPAWRSTLSSLKEAKHARQIRAKILSHFERAASPTTSLAEKELLLQFVVVGGGPTGVEFAGQIGTQQHARMQLTFEWNHALTPHFFFSSLFLCMISRRADRLPRL